MREDERRLLQLEKLQAVWNDGKVRFNWDVQGTKKLSSGCYLHIYSVGSDGRLTPERDDVVKGGSYQIECRGGAGVLVKRRYAVGFSQRMEHGEVLLQELREHLSEFLVEVVTGHGQIEWRAKVLHRAPEADEVEIRLKSSIQLEQGILGYRFRMDGKKFTFAIPQRIDKSDKQHLPGIIVPRDSGLELCVMDSAYERNLSIKQIERRF